jgi:2-dehydropantoate 2-reductase
MPTFLSSTPLSIAVLGVGGVGSTFAYHLARAGHDVTVVARPGSARLQQLQRDGGIVHKDGGRADVRVADALDEERAYDLVVVTTLAHQVDAVLAALARSKAKHVQFMFNTFDPERLRDAVGAARCSFGMPVVMATVDAQGKLDSKLYPGQKTLHGDRRCVDLFAGAGIPSAFDADMVLWVRCHAPMCIGFEGISIAGERRGGGASWAEAMVVARGVHGGFALIQGLGYRLYPSAKSVLNALPTFLLACMLWSASRITSFRELLATGANECRAIIDAMVTAAAAVKPSLATEAAAILAMKPAPPDAPRSDSSSGPPP